MDNQNKDAPKPTTSGLFSTPSTTPVTAAPAAAPEVDDEPEAPMPTEAEVLEALKSRARLMGIEFSNNIKAETLRARINAKLDGLEEEVEDERAGLAEPAEDLTPAADLNALTGEPANAPKKSFRQSLHDEQMRLVRCRITCMDPKKKDLHGEVFTIANEFIGTVKKFVPFGEVTDGGYHIPFCIFTMMDERRFLNIRVRKDPRTNREYVESNYAKEFAIEVLPALTERELQQLATAQAAAGSIDPASL